MFALVWSLPILSGLADALSRGVIKLTKVHKFILVAGGYFFALPFYFIWLLFEGIPDVHPVFWWVIAGHVPLLTLANIFTVEAHRSSPLLLTAPYLSLTPAFLLVTAPLMGVGLPTVWGVLGVLVITAGLYLLNTKDSRAGFLDPLKQLRAERGSRLMLVVGVIFAITANFDYLAFVNANAPFYLLVDHGLAGITSIVIAITYLGVGRMTKQELVPQGSWWPLVFYGVMIAASVVPHMLAFVWIPVVPYVIAGKRAGMILFTVGIGLVIAVIKQFGGRYTSEREHLQWRIPGTLMMVAGMVIIIFWGRNP